MDIRELILGKLKKEGKIKASDIMKETGFSRVYVHRFLRELTGEGRIALVDKANKAHYVAAGAHVRDTRGPVRLHRILRNIDLKEDAVLEGIKREGGLYDGVPVDTADIFTYAFTEILNNAIEHSDSKVIDILVLRDHERMSFDISDKGVGIFNNIMKKKGLKSPVEAIQDLLKGKQTTAPSFHSGEGIFFTSKAADHFIVRSFGKKLVFDNEIKEIFLKDVRRPILGTKVFFSIGLDKKKRLRNIFDRFTDDKYEFSKTSVKVKLYREGVEYISRSQARRILSGLEKFKTVELDFADIGTIGQGFADEVFRVWHSGHPDIRIIPVNAGENVEFMIRHVVPG